MYGSKMLIEYSLKVLIKVCHQSSKRGRLKVEKPSDQFLGLIVMSH
jgi:hypothetical protein